MLTTQNWANYDQKKSYRICKNCRKVKDRKYHQADTNYAQKQKNRYRMRRSAVIWAYGNVCTVCAEDDYTKLTINGDINFLYDSIVIKDGYQVICYNCSTQPYKSKYNLRYKKAQLLPYGNSCKKCKELRPECLIIREQQIFCYNCYYSYKAEKEEALKSLQALKC